MEGWEGAISIFGKFGRDERIRTSDPHTPSVMRYQAALRPDRSGAIRSSLWNMQAIRCRLLRFPDQSLIMLPHRADLC